MESRDDLIRSVREAGFYAVPRFAIDEYPVSVVCAKHEPRPGSGSFSFWVTCLGDAWYLASWGYRYWRIPSECSVAKVCIDYLTAGTSIGAPPQDVLKQYGLVEVSLDEFKTLAPGSAKDDARES